MDLYRSFRAVVKRHKFIEAGKSLIVGVSGGLDSMVLAHLLVQLKKDIDFKLSLAHVNYGLRGAESELQENLVCDFAKKNRLKFFASHPDLKSRKENFQQAAREFRYHYFAETAQSIGVTKVAVAHHLEDQVETILAQWLRGASLRGLSGMRAEREIKNQRSKVKDQKSKIKNSVRLIRPLLGFSKEQLRAYAQQENIQYIEDSSNASPKYWRNRLRQELLPVIQNLRPGTFEKICRFGEEMSELSAFVEQLAQDWLAEFSRKEDNLFWLPKPRWALLPKPLRLEILRQVYCALTGDSKNLKRDHFIRCEQLSLGKKGEGFYSLPRGIRFIRSGDDLKMVFSKDLRDGANGIEAKAPVSASFIFGIKASP